MVSIKQILAGLLTLLVLGTAASSQEIERTQNANLLMRSASFGSDISLGTIYTLVETLPGRWVAYAQRGELSSVTWRVIESPMSGAKAGYVTFLNGENEKLVLDVLEIETCYGITGEIRVGW